MEFTEFVISIRMCQSANGLATNSFFYLRNVILISARERTPSEFILFTVASRILFCYNAILLAFKYPFILLYPVSENSSKIVFKRCPGVPHQLC